MLLCCLRLSYLMSSLDSDWLECPHHHSWNRCSSSCWSEDQTNLSISQPVPWCCTGFLLFVVFHVVCKDLQSLWLAHCVSIYVHLRNKHVQNTRLLINLHGQQTFKLHFRSSFSINKKRRDEIKGWDPLSLCPSC